MITQPRPSLSPSRFSDGAFKAYVNRTNRAVNKADVIAKAFPILKSNNNVPSSIKRTFANLAALTDGTFINAQPDFYYNVSPDQLDPHVQKKLKSYIVPSVNDRASMLPNNFTEGKGPGGTRAVTKRQACYDGALGARAMQHLQSYGQPEPVYDNNAYTITSTFDGEHLHMYTTHPTQPADPSGRPEYHMNQCEAFAMTRNPETFRQGATAYRNMRDWIKEKRDEFIEVANEKAANTPQDMSFESSGYSEPSTSTNMATVLKSDTSADELAFDHGNATPRSGKRVKRGKPERSYRENRSGRRGRYTR
jgi:hypothetical protein